MRERPAEVDALDAVRRVAPGVAGSLDVDLDDRAVAAAERAGGPRSRSPRATTDGPGRDPAASGACARRRARPTGPRPRPAPGRHRPRRRPGPCRRGRSRRAGRRPPRRPLPRARPWRRPSSCPSPGRSCPIDASGGRSATRLDGAGQPRQWLGAVPAAGVRAALQIRPLTSHRRRGSRIWREANGPRTPGGDSPVGCVGARECAGRQRG